MEDYPKGMLYAHGLEQWKRFILDIREVMQLLKYKDVRSAIKWCEDNDVFVFTQGNTQIVTQVEFILAFYKPFIDHLKRTQENWKELFVSYISGDVRSFVGDASMSMRSDTSQPDIKQSFNTKTEEPMKKQRLPYAKGKVPGLRPYCSKCNREIGNKKCGLTGKSLKTCKHPEEHIFKAYITIPGSGGKQKTRELKTGDLTEAMLLKREFENEIASQDYQPAPIIHQLEEPGKSVLLVECMERYVDFLNNIGVELHMVKVRSDEYLWSVNDYFKKFRRALKANGIDPNAVRVDQVNDQMVAYYHKYILEELGHANKTYNKMMGLMRQFMNWLIEQKGYEIQNPFLLVQKRVVGEDKTIVTEKEFHALLEAITPKDPYQVLPSGNRKGRYKPWLRECFRLALETGLRREEFMCLQFSDIVFDENGNPLFIKVENYKVNRIRGGNDKSRQMKSIPITQGLFQLLTELGMDKYRDTDRFLIGPDEKSSRNTLIEFVSLAFTFYWKRTGIKKKLLLKHLRNTYLTALVKHFGDKAPTISDHGGLKVLMDHYANSEQLVSARHDFMIFEQQNTK